MRTSSVPLLLAGVALVMAFPLSVAAGDAGRTYFDHKSPPGSLLPFSDAVLVGNTLYVAGTLGLDPDTGKPPADPAAEARAVLEARKRIVETAGFKMDDFVSVTVVCSDLGLYDTFNGIYRTYFHEHYPARAFIGTDKVLRGGHFEVMGIAMRTGAKP